MSKQNLTPHFTLQELTESQTAQKHGLANVPTLEAVENLHRLCANTLEPLREALQLPVVITSGFRTKDLNDLLAHHSERSQHMLGQAADFYVDPGQSGLTRREALIKAFHLIITCEQIGYDQLILYPSFIHVSYVSRERNRHTILLGRSDGKLGYGKLSYANALKINS